MRIIKQVREGIGLINMFVINYLHYPEILQ